MTLNKLAIPVPSISLLGTITKANDLHSMKIPPTLPDFHFRGSSSTPLCLKAQCTDLILPCSDMLLPVGAPMLGNFYSCTFTCSILHDFLILDIDHPKYQT